MKLFLLLFLAGCAVRCDDNNYYVIEMPEADDATRAQRPLRVYWNVPTTQCTSKKTPFKNLDRFGIIQNTNDSFRGEKISILYDPGIFPALLYNNSSKELRFRNGGVPQEGDLQLHLKMFRIVLDQSIPDKHFSGIGIIDFESWRPILRQNFADVYPYRSISYDIERKNHWLWPPSWIKEEATHRFETAARIFMQNTIALAKKMRPKARWGYYGFPYCFNMANNNSVENCASNVKTENDQIDWLWMESTALYPSVYSSYRVGGEALGQLIRGRVREAARVQRGGLLLPYFWFRYRDGGFFHEDDLQIALKTFHQSEADGFIIWGSSNDVNTPEKCKSLLKYIENVMGPAVKRYTKPKDISNRINSESTSTTERDETTKEENLLSDSLNVTTIQNTKNYKTKSTVTDAPRHFNLNIHASNQNVTDSTVHVGNDSFVVYEDYDDTTDETLSGKADISFEVPQSSSAVTEVSTNSNEIHNSDDDMLLYELEPNNTDNILQLASNNAYDMLQSADDEHNTNSNNMSNLETTTTFYITNNSTHGMFTLASTFNLDTRNNSIKDNPEFKTFITFDDVNSSTVDINEYGPNMTTDGIDNISADVILETVITFPPYELKNSTDGLVQEIATIVNLDEFNNSTDNGMLEKSNTATSLISPDKLNNSFPEIEFEEYDDPILQDRLNLNEYSVLDDNDDATEEPNLVINLSIKKMQSEEKTVRPKTTPPPQMIQNSNKHNDNSIITQENEQLQTIENLSGSSSILGLVNIDKFPKLFKSEIDKMVHNIEVNEEIIPLNEPTTDITTSTYERILIWKDLATKEPSKITFAESLEKIIDSYTEANELTSTPTPQGINNENIPDQTFAESLENIIISNEPNDSRINLPEPANDTEGIVELIDLMFNSPISLGSENFTFDKLAKEDNTVEMLKSTLKVNNPLHQKNTNDVIKILNTIDLLQDTVNNKFQTKLPTPDTDLLDKRKTHNETTVLRNQYNMKLNKTTPVTQSMLVNILSWLKRNSSIQHRKVNQSETLDDKNQQKKEEKITTQHITKLEEKLYSFNEKNATYKNSYEITTNLGNEEASRKEQDSEYIQDNTASNASSHQVLIV